MDKAPVVIDRLQGALGQLETFLQSQGLPAAPEAVPQLQGDAARCQFIQCFKEVQRCKTQLDQYTDLTPEERECIEQMVPPETLQGFRGVYLDTAQRLREQRAQNREQTSPEVEQLDFEFVLFASAVIDYDYIMTLISRYTNPTPGKQTMNREALVGLIQSDAQFLDDREEITAYIDTLKAGKGLDESAIREGFEQFKKQNQQQRIQEIAQAHGLDVRALQDFMAQTLNRMIFDGEQLSELLAPLQLGWKARTQKETALMQDLIPLLHKQAQGREISGLEAYEQ